jgi:Protein of unknown function (DUF2934)
VWACAVPGPSKIRFKGAIVAKTAKKEPEAKAISPGDPEHHARISLAAYERWQGRACAPGHDWEDWFIAESVVYGGK